MTKERERIHLAGEGARTVIEVSPPRRIVHVLLCAFMISVMVGAGAFRARMTPPNNVPDWFAISFYTAGLWLLLVITASLISNLLAYEIIEIGHNDIVVRLKALGICIRKRRVVFDEVRVLSVNELPTVSPKNVREFFALFGIGGGRVEISTPKRTLRIGRWLEYQEAMTLMQAIKTKMGL